MSKPKRYNGQKYKFVQPNTEKIYRCPKCETIPKEALADGQALFGKYYYCRECKVYWKVR